MTTASNDSNLFQSLLGMLSSLHAAEIARLNARIAELEAASTTTHTTTTNIPQPTVVIIALNSDNHGVPEESISMQAERDALRASLEKAEQRLVAYGEHRHCCPARIADSHHACTCGLSAARVDARPVWGASKPATNTIPEAIAKAGDV